MPGDHAGRPVKDFVLFWVIAVAFGTFAMFGTEPAELFLSHILGGRTPSQDHQSRPPGDGRRA